MLHLTNLKKNINRNLRPIGIIDDENEKPVGFVKVGDNGENLIELPENLKLSVCPETRENMVDTIFITGGQGSGKSTWCGLYCNNFIRMFPNFKPEHITIISADDVEDPAYNFPHRHILIDEEFAINPPTLDDFTNKEKGGENRSIVIFDDIESIKSKDKLKALEGVIEGVMCLGRKRGINCLFISHQSANGKQTRLILTELNKCVFFPKLGTSRNLSYMLTHHLGMHQDLRNALKDDGWGRWVCFSTNSPQLLLSQNRIAMYDYDEVNKALKKKSFIDKKRAQKEASEMLEY